MICYNFASRSRPEKFFACLDNIRELSASKDYFVLAKLDEDQREQYAAVINYPEVIVKWGLSLSKVHAINRGLENVKFDILCNHSDDMFFTCNGFDEIIKQHCTEDSFVHFPDGKTTLCTYSIMDYIYFSRFNYVYNPAYKSLWCDNEAMAVAEKLGRYKFVDEKILEHRHPANGFGKRDAQYRRTESLYWVDKKTFERRQLGNFGLAL